MTRHHGCVLSCKHACQLGSVPDMTLFLMSGGTFAASIFYFRCSSVFYFRPWLSYCCLPNLACVPVMRRNLVRGIGIQDQSSLPVCLTSLCSSFVLHSGLCRGGKETVWFTVKIWQKGNEETLSPTDLDTTQIGFAGIPAIYQLPCFPFSLSSHHHLPFVLYL